MHFDPHTFLFGRVTAIETVTWFLDKFDKYSKLQKNASGLHI